MKQGSASVTINAKPEAVWATLADITRMGEWSPECVACRWSGGATGPAVGAEFEGDNEARVFGKVAKRWTTTSVISGCQPGRLFEFIAEGQTTWRYVLEPSGEGTAVTESFSYEAKGLQGFLYDVVLRRPAAMTKGMRRTLERLRTGVEAES